MELVEFIEMVTGHTQVTARPKDRSVQQRPVEAVTPIGIHSRLPWGTHQLTFIDWPSHDNDFGYDVQGTTLTWLHKGDRVFSYTFPLTVEQALAAAYDEVGQPRELIDV